ncbi:hypothetical protein [Pantoea stewartii]|uniref:hypothetical protein n=1 Tax=Pantoea stewartii TaxID=66269 RepID=UPI0025A24C07|nr:hypothetical protein [Pantoea stewartii]
MSIKWDGEGLPPVGTRCEYNSESRGWVVCEILLYRKTVVIMESDIEGEGITMTHTKNAEFRPIRTEAERKRKEIAQQMCTLFGNGIEIDEKEGYGKAWLDAYDAIAAGKIPGIRLTDDPGN